MDRPYLPLGTAGRKHRSNLDWEDFCEEFHKEFTPSHADALAINRLESNGYYQKNRSLDDYIDKFQDLIVDSGYTDPETIVVKFRRGLNTQIQNAVATMASGRPSDASPEQWYSMARTIDQNRAANEAFSSTYRSPVPSLRPAATSVIHPTVPSVRARLSTGRARGPWPEVQPGPTLKVRGPGQISGGPAPNWTVGPGPDLDRPYLRLVFEGPVRSGFLA
jgi:hypothetical protein